MGKSQSLKSMTGFASAKGDLGQHSWSWDLRSVNAKGLDLRLRVPDWLEGLEAHLRGELSKALNRGSVTLGLRVTRTDDSIGALALNETTLASVLEAMSTIETQAGALGVHLAPSTASDLLSVRGLLEVSGGDDDNTALLAQLKSEFPDLLAAFLAMRDQEGAALISVLQDQLEKLESLTAEAATLAEARKDVTAANLRANLTRVLDNTDGADPDRVAQELALIAVKADVTEEIDRLGAHVGAARDLLGKGGAVGRKLDFLMQEFNREANTLCSKSQSKELTNVGLELKAVIDQMREQVQNVE